MEATHRQRVLRTLALMLVGTAGLTLLTLDPLTAFAWPPFLAMFAAMLLWTVAENLLLKQDEPKQYNAKLQTRIMQATVMLAAFVGILDAWHFPAAAPRGWQLTIAGLSVVTAGAGIRLVAIKTLDKHFSYELRVESGHEIVQRGIYGVLRHPSYLGIILIAVGAPLILQSLLGAAVGLVAMTAVTIWRISTEEAMLRRAFGEAYVDYSRRSWRLVPFVY
jgi:protein-S-isoprenylcysteine O-methyltransferase Ste14